MNIRRTASSAAAAIAVALGASLNPVAAIAADVTPAQVAGDAALSTVSEFDPATSEYASKPWYKKTASNPKVKYFEATSPSMDITVPLQVITPTGNFDESRPTFYLLNGAGGAEQDMDWVTMSKVVSFYSDKDVNVVIPQAGAFSYYTDWQESPRSGYLKQDKIKWETFLTKELPGPLEEALNGNGKRAIAGMSMSATSSLLLAEHNPGFYDAVGSYSGCAATSTLLPRLYTQLTVNRGGGNADQMWGPIGGEVNHYNDALVNAEKLRGTELYISTNSGLAGDNDLLSSQLESRGLLGASSTSSELVVSGGIIEAAMNSCTHDLKAKLDHEDIDATYKFRNTGTHAWSGWRQDLIDSWPTYARAFELAE